MANRHAIVIGGSMAGLCTARVLSDFFERVTVIDRDSFPEGALERPGVPQSRHVHALLARGRYELDALFPGFERTMLERGAHLINFSMDFAALRAEGWAPRRPDSITTLFASRLLIEAIVRELLRKIANVQMAERTDAIGLVAARDGALRVRGLRVRSRDGGGEREIEADLVADVSGRGSRSPAWLGELGIEPPAETVVDSYAGYSSRWFNAPAPERRPPQWWWKGIWLDPKIPEHMNAGVLFPLERYKLAKAQGKLDLVKSHETFFGNDETQVEATPALIIERGEKVFLPPALVFQGTKDEWTSVELAERLAAAYRGTGGIFDLQLLEGERHTFVNEHPFAPNSVKAVEMVKAFIKKYGSKRQALR